MLSKLSLPRRMFVVAVLAVGCLGATTAATAQFGEIGFNDFRISFADGTGDNAVAATNPALAFDPSTNTVLVVWVEFTSNTETYRVRGRRVDGITGQLLGVETSLLSTPAEVENPAVAYNAMVGQFIVAVEATALDADQVEGEEEIFVFNVDPASTQTFYMERISDAGPLGNSNFDATRPDIACSSSNENCLVVWKANTGDGLLEDNEFEIFGQLVSAATGAQVGVDDFRISDMGGSGDSSFDASSPQVDHNSVDDQYLVVWTGEDNLGGLVDGEDEIFGQLLDSNGGSLAPNDFRISFMGGTGDSNFVALLPRVAHNATHNEYLVVWRGEDDTGGLIDGEREIFGQFLSADGSRIGAPDFRISDMGDTGDTDFFGSLPDLAYDSDRDEYLVTWHGDDNVGFLVDNEFEIFGQRISAASGSEVGLNDFRMSDLGPTANTSYEALNPRVVYNEIASRYLVIWNGDDDRFGLVANEIEIFGQFLGEQTIFIDGFESGNTALWSFTVP